MTLLMIVPVMQKHDVARANTTDYAARDRGWI